MKTKRNPWVAIIVLNWNNWQDTLECLASLEKLDYQNQSLLIVDNGSQNESLLELKKWLGRKGFSQAIIEMANSLNLENTLTPEAIPSSRPGKYSLVHLTQNGGYAGGNNIALNLINYWGFEYAWILNNDTLVSANSLKKLVQSAEADMKVGMVISNNIHLMGDSSIDHKVDYALDREVEIQSLAGGSILVRMGCYRDIGPIDEKYFCYGEELDWSLAARKRGWKLIKNFRSVIFHKWGRSTRSTRIEKYVLGKKILRISWEGFLTPGYYESRNGIYFLKKNRHSSWFLCSILRVVHLVLQILLYDDHKLGRLRIILKGSVDGFRGRMGKAGISS